MNRVAPIIDGNFPESRRDSFEAPQKPGHTDGQAPTDEQVQKLLLSMRIPSCGKVACGATVDKDNFFVGCSITTCSPEIKAVRLRPRHELPKSA